MTKYGSVRAKVFFFIIHLVKHGGCLVLANTLRNWAARRNMCSHHIIESEHEKNSGLAKAQGE